MTGAAEILRLCLLLDERYVAPAPHGRNIKCHTYGTAFGEEGRRSLARCFRPVCV